MAGCGSVSQSYVNELIQNADSVLGGRSQLIVLIDSSNYLFADLIWRFRRVMSRPRDLCVCVCVRVCVCVCVCVLCNPDLLQK